MGASNVTESSGNLRFNVTIPGLAEFSMHIPAFDGYFNDQNPNDDGERTHPADNASGFATASQGGTHSATSWAYSSTAPTAASKHEDFRKQAAEGSKPKANTRRAEDTGSKRSVTSHGPLVLNNHKQIMVLGKEGEVHHHIGPVAVNGQGACIKVFGEFHFRGPVAINGRESRIDLSEASSASRFHGPVAANAGYVLIKEDAAPFMNVCLGEVRRAYE